MNNYKKTLKTQIKNIIGGGFKSVTLAVIISVLFVTTLVTAATTISENINTAGTLTVTGASTLATTTIANDLTVDTDTLYVDSVNGRVGVGTVSPSSLFTVDGMAEVESLTVLSTGIGITSYEDIAVYGTSDETQLLVRGYLSQSSPLATFQSGAVTPYDIFRIENDGKTRIGYSTATAGDAKLAINGYVGINTESPSVQFEVVGELYATNGGRTVFLSASAGNNSGVVGTKTNNNLEFRANNITRMFITTDGDIGMGTTSPAVKLDVYGDSIRAFNIATSTCDSTTRGSMFYNELNDSFWGCVNSGWVKLNN